MPSSQNDSWIIDVGAFDGAVGRELKRRFAADGCRVLYVEPDLSAFASIGVEAPDVKVPFAVAGHDGEIDFHFYQPGTHSVLETDERAVGHYVDGFTGKPAVPEDWRAKRTLRVPCRRLDSLCEELGIRKVRFLKIDCQGYDLEAVRSMGERLSIVDELVLEAQTAADPVYKNASRPEEIVAYLREKGFLYVRRQPQSFGQELNMYFKRAPLLGGLKAEPLVSVVTPSFNGARFIERCIESVLSQDYPFVELIVQDGGSTDGTVDILKKYGDRIRWESAPDRGQSDGLDKALRKCRGAIVGVLNADDEYLPEAARWAVEAMARHPEAAVVYGQQHNIDSDGKILFSSEGPRPYRFKKIFCCEQVIPAQAAFIRRSALEATGSFADATRPTCPDYEMWVRLGLRHQMRYVPGFVANYRIHPGSEGQREDVIHKMVASKREIVDRVCSDPATPLRVRLWRRRAHAGILKWSACHFMKPLASGKGRQAMAQLREGLRTYPTPAAFIDFLYQCLRVRGADWPAPGQLARICLRVFRENARAADKYLAAGIVYRFVYSPIKRRLQSR